ncbi:hypothetical protein [Streptomyces sp. NPDC017988]|uniref:hypothetical protein n=1 Tax=Streptomyces sp. NPDC017988 TaxID=3365025 RepID=UPI00379D42D0
MTEQTRTDWYLILFRVAALLTMLASVGSLVRDVPWLVVISAVCFTAQLVGWRRHARQRGDAA